MEELLGVRPKYRLQFFFVATMIMKYRNSRPFMDLLQQIPNLSRPPSVFKNFPGPEKMNRPKPSQPTGFKEFQESAQRTVGVGRLPFP